MSYANTLTYQANIDAQHIFGTNSVATLIGYTIVNNQIVPQYVTNFSGTFTSGSYAYDEPFSGPSGLRFNATAGSTYYIAADTKGASSYIISNGVIVFNVGGRGPIQLNWAYHPAGVFRFASEDVDETGSLTVLTNHNPVLIYKCAETEGGGALGNNNSSGNLHGVVGPTTGVEEETTIHDHYPYDVQGLLVTVTRVAGASGRVSVDYSTVDGNTNTIINGDIPAVGGVDYTPVQGTLVFDDFEMSKTILIPIASRNPQDAGGGIINLNSSGPIQNRDFQVVLSNPQRDSAESTIVSPPRVDPIFGTVVCRILSTTIDPLGPSSLPVVTTNISVQFGGILVTNITTNNIIVDQFGNLLQPTNAIFNFSKAHYRVDRDSDAFWGATPLTVYVNRRGTNTAAFTVHYRFDEDYLDQNGPDDDNNEFPLQPGSDYAVPTPPNADAIKGTNSDFAGVGGDSGSLSFPGGQNNPFQSQPIHFTVQNNGLTEFNKDFLITLYEDDSHNNPFSVGMVDQCTVTILFDDTVPPRRLGGRTLQPGFRVRFGLRDKQHRSKHDRAQPRHRSGGGCLLCCVDRQ